MDQEHIEQYILGNESVLDKPPLGLMPKSIHQTKRFHEICAAIVRYYDSGKELPIEWIEEYNELVGIVRGLNG